MARYLLRQTHPEGVHAVYDDVCSENEAGQPVLGEDSHTDLRASTTHRADTLNRRVS